MPQSTETDDATPTTSHGDIPSAPAAHANTFDNEDTYTAYEPPVSNQPRIQITPLSLWHPWRWLALGFDDLRAHPWIALFYGLCFWFMALLVRWIFKTSPQYVISIISGCLLVGPLLAMGLYDVSRQRQLGLAVRFSESLTCWEHHLGSLGIFLIILTILELLWGRASLVIFAVFFNADLSTQTPTLAAIFKPENYEFLIAYALVGAIFAILVFCSCVVSIPLIRDCNEDAIIATITSFRLVATHPLVMFEWGFIIVFFIIFSLILPYTYSAVIIFTSPWLGHATWHAYKQSIHRLNSNDSIKAKS